MQVIKDSADITTYFVLRDSTNHAPKTDVTITDIDLYYVTHKAAISAKADATALAAADSAHADNKAYHVGQGLYRVDWPDVWTGAVGTTVQLIVVCTGVDTTFLEVEITDPAQTGDSYAVVAHTDYGNAKLVRSTTPANTLTVDANHLVAVPASQKVDVDTIKTQAVTCAAGVTVLASVGTAVTSTAQTGDSYAIVKSGGTGDAAAIKTKTDYLPSATAGAAGGVMISGSNAATTLASLTVSGATTLTGQVTGTNASNDLRGISVNMIKNQSVTCTTGVTFNANVGTTQPVNFTGTAGSALVKSDMVDVAGAAVSTSTAQIGVNAVQAGGTAWGSGAITAASIANGAIDAATFAADVDAEIAAMVWNALAASYGGAGTYGQAVEDILADTNELQVDDYPTSIAAIKTVVDTIQADTDLLDDAAGGLADIHTDVAAVKTVVDLVEDIVRNQMDITDSTGAVSLKNDVGVEMLTATVTDNSTTTTRTRLV